VTGQVALVVAAAQQLATAFGAAGLRTAASDLDLLASASALSSRSLGAWGALA
jgi:hypothetical protein